MIIGLPAGKGIFADSAKTRAGHTLMGEILGEDETELFLNVKKIQVRKKAISEFGFEKADGSGNEFFAKIELRDGSNIIGWIEKKPGGDVLVKKHAVFGENHPVSGKEIRRVTAIGKMRLSVDMGNFTGFVTAENPETMTLDLDAAQQIKVLHREILSRNPPRSRLRASGNALPESAIGVIGSYALPGGKLAEFLDRAFGAGVDYLHTMPDIFYLLGYWSVAGRFQYFAGKNLNIYFVQLYPGILRAYQFANGHAVFARIGGGINLEYMKDRSFTGIGAVGGGIAGAGYLFTRAKISILLAGYYQYFYDRSYPLAGFGAECGVFYAL